MSNDKGSITVSILGKDYQFSCTPEEEDDLRQSARYLNEQMTDIKSRGATLGFEKVAIMAALNISHDLLKENKQNSSLEDNSVKIIENLEEKIDSALQSARQMEI